MFQNDCIRLSEHHPLMIVNGTKDPWCSFRLTWLKKIHSFLVYLSWMLYEGRDATEVREIMLRFLSTWLFAFADPAVVRRISEPGFQLPLLRGRTYIDPVHRLLNPFEFRCDQNGAAGRREGGSTS